MVVLDTIFDIVFLSLAFFILGALKVINDDTQAMLSRIAEILHAAAVDAQSNHDAIRGDLRDIRNETKKARALGDDDA